VMPVTRLCDHAHFTLRPCALTIAVRSFASDR
jgi:hypothetical protein